MNNLFFLIRIKAPNQCANVIMLDTLQRKIELFRKTLKPIKNIETQKNEFPHKLICRAEAGSQRERDCFANCFFVRPVFDSADRVFL